MRQALSYAVNSAGWLLLGLSIALSDSTFWFVKNHGDPACYQFPILSSVGCLDSGFAHEISLFLCIVSGVLISAGAYSLKT